MIQYKEIEQKINAWQTKFEDKNGYKIYFNLNPEYFRDGPQGKVDQKTLTGLDSWVNGIIKTFDQMAADKSKSKEFKEKVTAAVLLAYDNNDPMYKSMGLPPGTDSITRIENGLSFSQSVESIGKGAPADLAASIQKAVTAK